MQQLPRYVEGGAEKFGGVNCLDMQTGLSCRPLQDLIFCALVFDKYVVDRGQ